MKNNIRLSLLVLCFLIVASYFGYAQFTAYSVKNNGVTIAVQTEPVDPIDPLLGRYVEIHYSFSSIRSSDFKGIGTTPKLHQGDFIWLIFEKTNLTQNDAPIYTYIGWSDKPGQSEIQIKSKIISDNF
ncbi:MAG: GDYXXLXY domain-containing protein [Bacilli bacterium]